MTMPYPLLFYYIPSLPAGVCEFHAHRIHTFDIAPLQVKYEAAYPYTRCSFISLTLLSIPCMIIMANEMSEQAITLVC